MGRLRQYPQDFTPPLGIVMNVDSGSQESGGPKACRMAHFLKYPHVAGSQWYLIGTVSHLHVIQSELLLGRRSGCHQPVVAQLSLNFVKASYLPVIGLTDVNF